jgi:hypothetical protein
MKRWNLHFLLGIPIFITIFTISSFGLWLAWENLYFNTENFAEINEENITETSISNELPKKLKEADVKIVFGAAEIKINAIPDENSGFLYEGTHSSNFFTLSQRLDTFGDKADLTFKASPFIKRPFNSKSINELNLNFSQKINHSFDIQSGASDIDLNLKSLKVKNLDIEAGASKITIRFGDNVNTDVHVRAGASSLKIYLPKDLGVKIKTKSALVSQNFEDFGLVKNGRTWESESCEDAKNKVNIELESGVSKVELVE